VRAQAERGQEQNPARSHADRWPSLSSCEQSIGYLPRYGIRSNPTSSDARLVAKSHSPLGLHPRPSRDGQLVLARHRVSRKNPLTRGDRAKFKLPGQHKSQYHVRPLGGHLVVAHELSCDQEHSPFIHQTPRPDNLIGVQPPVSRAGSLPSRSCPSTRIGTDNYGNPITARVRLLNAAVSDGPQFPCSTRPTLACGIAVAGDVSPLHEASCPAQ
jgi:hypothetical protein